MGGTLSIMKGHAGGGRQAATGGDGGRAPRPGSPLLALIDGHVVDDEDISEDARFSSDSEGDGEGEGGKAKEAKPSYKMLKELKWEEAELKETLKELESLSGLMEVIKTIVAKQDEIDKLEKVVRKLKGEGAGSASNPGEGTAVDMDVPTPGPGAKTAERIFPEEIWEMIFKNVTHPKDLQNCVKADPLFSKILHPSKTKFLFPQVFRQLCRQLGNREIQSCRQVCQEWNVGVDTFLDDHPSLRPFDMESFNPRDPDLAPPMKSRGMDLHKFTNSQRGDLRTKMFVRKMCSHPRNPFVGRAVTIQIVEEYTAGPIEIDGQIQPQMELFRFLPLGEAVGRRVHQQKNLFYVELWQFLVHFGRHIWYLNLEFRSPDNHVDWQGNDPEVRHHLERTTLLCLPNLRRLRLTGSIPPFWQTVDMGPLPALGNLETLQINHFTGVGMSVGLSSFLRKYRSQLKRLDIKWETLELLYLGGNGSADPNWENLVELHVSGVGGQVDIQPIIKLRMPHLRKLTLTPEVRQGPNMANGYQCHFGMIMDIVLNLSATTRLSVLRLFQGFKKEQISQAPGNLFAPPTLTTLEVEHYGWASDYTFLLRFPFIQNLIVFWPEECLYSRQGREIDYRRHQPKPITPGGSDQFCQRPKLKGGMRGLVKLHECMCQGRIYESEIWELLPRLKVFTFQREVYTREAYQRFILKKTLNEAEEDGQPKTTDI